MLQLYTKGDASKQIIPVLISDEQAELYATLTVLAIEPFCSTTSTATEMN